jgi:hypothetical protein
MAPLNFDSAVLMAPPNWFSGVNTLSSFVLAVSLTPLSHGSECNRRSEMINLDEFATVCENTYFRM